MLEELNPQHVRQKSFYGKARVETVNNCLFLHSYSTVVCKIDLFNHTAKVFGWFSNTTGRHLREFLLQNGFEAINKKQILKDYYSD